MYNPSDRNKRSTNTRLGFQPNQPQRDFERSWHRVNPPPGRWQTGLADWRASGASATSQTVKEPPAIKKTSTTTTSSNVLSQSASPSTPSLSDTSLPLKSPPPKSPPPKSPPPKSPVKVSLPKHKKPPVRLKYTMDWSSGRRLLSLEDLIVCDSNDPIDETTAPSTTFAFDEVDTLAPTLHPIDKDPPAKSDTKNDVDTEEEWTMGSLVEEKSDKDLKGHLKWIKFSSERDLASPVNLTLHQKVKPDQQETTRRTKGFAYAYHMDHNQVLAAIAKGDLYKCQLRVNQRNTQDAYGISDILDDDVYFYGSSARNRALDNDVVAVRLLNVDDVWQERKDNRKRAAERRQRLRRQQEDYQPIDDDQDNNDDVDDAEVEVDESEDDDRKPKYAGEVVYILDRDEGLTYTGIILPHRPGSAATKPTNDIKQVWFQPTDRRTPLVMIDVRNAPADILSRSAFYEKQIMEVAIIRWSPDHKVPYGKVIRCLGPIGSIAVEQQAILIDKHIMDTPFDHVVLKYVETLPKSISATELAKRRDLRDELVLTIDPLNAKDLDDALHIKRLDDGCFEVGVHIADVTHYVKQNSLLDSEVEKRGTTTYLTNRSIPMLPPALSEDLCSLNPHSDKLTFSVIWKLDQSGNIRDQWFGRTVIRSCAKLTYDEAQNVIDYGYLPEDAVVDTHSKQQVEESIMDLFKLSSVMRIRRYEEGALSLNSVKLAFTLDDKDDPIGVVICGSTEANKLVEEFMLLANFSVAEKIYEAYPFIALLRRHPRPIERRLEQFVETTKKLGYDMTVDSSAAFQTSLDEINDLAVKDVLLLLAIQSMRRANYICSGAARNNNYLHYALNQDYYTHFTSPIRRYADIVVHRLLDGALCGKEDFGYDTKTIQKVALHCNRRKDGAKNAQQADTMLFLANYLHTQQHTQGLQTERAIVIGVTENRFDIYIPAYGLEYGVQLGRLPLDRSEFNKGRLDLYWKPGEQVATVATLAPQCEQPTRVAQLVGSTMDASLNGAYDDDYDDDDDDDDLDYLDDNVGTIAPRKVHPAALNQEAYMQTIDTLATLHVNLIPDKTRPLTRIHIFPVNPFAFPTNT